MKKLLPALLMTLALVGCATNDPQPPGDDRGRPMERERDGGGMRGGAGALASMLPSGSWWFDTRYAEKLALSGDQKSHLDALANDRMPGLDQSRREVVAAEADFRTQLNRDGVTTADLDPVSARVRDARGRMVDREVRYLSEVRMILTHDQWWTLQSEMQSMRQDARPQNRRGGRGGSPGGGRRGGRGGYPGGGGVGPFG